MCSTVGSNISFMVLVASKWETSDSPCDYQHFKNFLDGQFQSNVTMARVNRPQILQLVSLLAAALFLKLKKKWIPFHAFYNIFGTTGWESLMLICNNKVMKTTCKPVTWFVHMFNYILSKSFSLSLETSDNVSSLIKPICLKASLISNRFISIWSSLNSFTQDCSSLFTL